MKKLLMVVLAVFLTVSIAGAAEESNFPDSQRTDQFTIHQQTDNDDQVKALIGADRIPVVDNADLENPQFVGERQGAAASIELQKQTSQDARSAVSPSVPTGTVSPAAPIKP